MAKLNSKFCIHYLIKYIFELVETNIIIIYIIGINTFEQLDTRHIILQYSILCLKLYRVIY